MFLPAAVQFLQTSLAAFSHAGLHRSTTSDRLRRARFSSPPAFFAAITLVSLLHAESFYMQEVGEGKIIPFPVDILHWAGFPAQFCYFFLGQTQSKKKFCWAGTGPPSLRAEIGPTMFWADDWPKTTGPILAGLGSAHLFVPAQPDFFYYYYIL